MVLQTTNATNLTPEEIVELLVGVGVSVSNIEITGSDLAIGSFAGGRSEELGIDSGVILSSGDISDASGPNDEDNTGQALGTPGDEDLNAVLAAQNSDNNNNNEGDDEENGDSGNTETTNDAIVLEFDFVPENEEFVFEYVFASEEYNEFANSAFNDIFAFLLNGENIALIPGTTTPVSINNINAGENTSFFRNNDSDDVEGNPFNTEFDGFTTPLAVKGYVTPGQTQNLKLVIADTSDSILDSAVFLKEGSLSTPPIVGDATIASNERDIFSIEGTTSPALAKLKFSLLGTNTDSVNEVGVFVVDDELGTIDGVSPGTSTSFTGKSDYEQLALAGVRSRAIFTGLNDPLLAEESLTRFLNFEVGSKLGFYLITDGTSDMVLSDTPLYFYQQEPQVFFSFPEENTDVGVSEPLKVTSNGDGFTLAWEDDSEDGDYDDLILSVEVAQPNDTDILNLTSRRQGDVQKEIVDLTVLEDGESATVKVNIFGESDLESTTGLYRLADAQGTVIDSLSGNRITPEQDGYAEAAIGQRVFEFGKEESKSVELEKGFYAPYIVVNSTAEEWLISNPTNFPHFDSFAYSPFMAANGITFDYEHLALLGDNTFGFEDLRIAESDFDFDDMVMQLEF